MPNTEQLSGLHVLTHHDILAPRTFEMVEYILSGGKAISVLQFREKNLDREAIDLAKRIRELTRGKCLFIINDFVELARDIGADGVHVGQSDMPAVKARKIIGKNMILGVSASTPEEATQAEIDGADYIGAGPVFDTQTKTDGAFPIGLPKLRAIKNLVSIPVIGIGGITLENAAGVADIADGLALISGIWITSDPRETARRFSEIINQFRK